MDDEESISHSWWSYFITECTGTALLMCIGCMGCQWNFGMGPVIPAFTFGFGILAILQMFSHITVVHINPAVSLGLCFMNKLSVKLLFTYLLAQYSGALIGIYLLKLVMPSNPDLCNLDINANISWIQGLFVEFWASFVLFMAIVGITHRKNENNRDFISIKVGLVITGLIFAAGPFTGAGINPARALGPAVANYNCDNMNMISYQIGPYVGMITAAVLCRFVLDLEIFTFVLCTFITIIVFVSWDRYSKRRFFKFQSDLKVNGFRYFPIIGNGLQVIGLEFIGTELLIHIGCMSCLWDYELGPTIPAFSFGLAVLTIVQIFGHIAPVHINPAVSLATLIMGEMHWKSFCVYFVAQHTGALTGMYLLKIMMPYSVSLCVLQINFNIDATGGFFIEFWASFVLFMTIASTMHPKNKKHGDSVPIKIGFMIAGLVLAAGPFTGAGLNPARALSPAVIYNIWEEHWLYHIGPYAGMAAAATLSRLLLGWNSNREVLNTDDI